MAICPEDSCLGKIRQETLETLHEVLITFLVAGEINPPYKHCCVTLNNFILLTVKYGSKINKEEIV